MSSIFAIRSINSQNSPIVADCHQSHDKSPVKEAVTTPNIRSAKTFTLF